jgi:hypothetical protein
MAPLIYRCPVTGLKVQGWFADEATPSNGTNVFDSVKCLACSQLHLVHRPTGRVLGQKDE